MKDTTDHIASRLLLAVLLLLSIVAAVFGFLWDKEPPLFNIKDATVAVSDRLHKPIVQGSATVSAVITIVDTLFTKPGGYLSNDMLPPGVFMDNMPSWEYGALTQSRDMIKILRDHFTDSPKTGDDDEDIALAETRFSAEYTSWVMPDAQSEYEEGNEFLESYLKRLADPENPQAVFAVNVANIDLWLAVVQSRLGSLSQKLMASVGQNRINADVLDQASETTSEKSVDDKPPSVIKTPWRQIDNVFYEARGSSWALVQLLKAAQLDFATVINSKNARVRLAQAIRELEAAQQPVNSPMILNGDAFGMLPNHSLVLAAYLTRANVAITELRETLKKGQ